MLSFSKSQECGVCAEYRIEAGFTALLYDKRINDLTIIKDVLVK